MTNGTDPVSLLPPDEIPRPSRVTSPWTPHRLRLLSWLKEKAPSLAELYETAVILLEDQPLHLAVAESFHIAFVRSQMPCQPFWQT